MHRINPLNIFIYRQDNSFSSRFIITADVSRGSHQVPDFYDIYTADISQTSNSLIAAFVDDTAILSTSDDIFTAAHNL